MNRKRLFKLVGFFVFLFYVQQPHLYAYKLTDTQTTISLTEWIHWMEKKASYRFLFRESQVRTLVVQLDTTKTFAQIFQDVAPQLNKQDLDLLVYQQARQVVIFPLSTQKASLNTISGTVIDDQSGERLPFATVQWNEADKVRGVTTNLSGQFQISTTFPTDTLHIKWSYIGYQSYELRLPKAALKRNIDLSVRLTPMVTASQEVVIKGSYLFTENAEAQQSIALMSGIVLGEENTIGALQSLPSVQVTGAMNGGLHVRGSAADGFNVFLDGIRVYNQSHFFGLFDNFNANAVQYASLYYDVVPANMDAASGGILALNTRNGSLNEPHISVGLSSSSAQLTFESPIKKGKSSVLVSAKHSLLDAFPLGNTTNLTHWGLDVDRRKKSVIEGLQFNTENTELVNLNQASARFGDFHLGYFQENNRGSRFQLNAYFGFDDMRSDYRKLTEIFDASSVNGRKLTTRSALTENQWNNAKISAHFDKKLSNKLHYLPSVGFSLFKSNFYKEDFGFLQINSLNGALERLESPLQIQSIINDLTVNQKLEWLSAKSSVTVGLDYQFLMAEYFEDSFEKSQLFIQQEAHKIAAYASSYIHLGEKIRVEQGLRAVYFEPDQSLRWSPRIKINALLTKAWTASFGYSLHNQFMNRVRFSNVLSSDVWVIADREQPPMQIEQWSAALYFRPSEQFTLQLEVYQKTTQNLRLHELDWYDIPNSFVNVPWFFNSRGYARGLELSIQKTLGPIQLQQSYTLSESTIQNDQLNEGKAFFADWDRPHQATTLLKWQVNDNLNLRFVQTFASGNPNRLFLLGQDQHARLDHFIRSDFSLDWTKKLAIGNITVAASVYNFTNNQNSWYREIGVLLNPSNPEQLFTEAPIEVYDLGIQPSFSIKLRF